MSDSAVIDAINSGTHDNKVIVLNSSKTLAANKNITRTLVTLKIVRNGKLTISVDSTIDCNIIIDSGGLIEIAAGKKLTINGVLEAGLYKIFNLVNLDTSEVIGKPKVKAVYPVWFGAIGDYAGSNTDNFKFFRASLKMIDASAGGTISLPNLNENNDYRISDSWNITKSNTTIFVDKGVTIRTIGATNLGGVIGFGQASPNPILENVTITGGGAVRSSTSGSDLSNAIGFTRVTGFKCIGMYVPASTQKGITAQLDCKNGIIRDNIIENTGEDGITVELIGVENIVISNNVIKNTTKKGIYVPGGYDYKKISIVNNLIENTKEAGIYVAGNHPTSSVVNGFLVSDNRLVYPETPPSTNPATDGAEGIWVNAARNVTISNNYIYKARKEGLRIENSAEVMVTENFIDKPSYGNNQDTPTPYHYDAIRSLGANNKLYTVVSNVIRKDATYGYKNTIRVDSGEKPFICANRFDTGDTDLISGYLTKVYFDSYIDGDSYSTNFKSSDRRRTEQTVTFAASVNIDHSKGSSALIGITGNLTVNSITNSESGDTIIIRIRNTSGSTWTLAYGTGIIGPSGGLGSIATGKTRFLGLINVGGTWNEYINYEYTHSA